MSAKIEIDEIVFEKAGRLWYSGTVEGEPFEGDLLKCHKDFDLILPKVEPGVSFNFIDQDDLCSGTMDDFGNLHWLIKIDGAIKERRIYLKPIVETLLYEKYINQ